MARGHKQFYVEYESDEYSAGYRINPYTGEYYKSKIHTAGNASSIRSAKSIIRNIRKNYAEENPRNFRVYDCWADVDPETNHVPCVYEEN